MFNEKEYSAGIKLVNKMNKVLDSIDLTTKEGRNNFANCLISFGMITQIFVNNPLAPRDLKVLFIPMNNKLKSLNEKFVEG